MRKTYNDILKELCHDRIVSARIENNLTQAQMAEYLVMDLRSYANIDSGRSSCSLLTFVLYLIYFCTDITDFIQGIQISFDNARQNVA